MTPNHPSTLQVHVHPAPDEAVSAEGDLQICDTRHMGRRQTHPATRRPLGQHCNQSREAVGHAFASVLTWVAEFYTLTFFLKLDDMGISSHIDYPRSN